MTTLRWVIPIFALFVLGPMGGALVGSLRAKDGSGEVTLLLSSGVLGGLFAWFGVGVLTLGAGVCGAVLADRRTGLVSAGLVLAWAAYRAGAMGRVLALEPGGLILLVVEGVLVVGLVAGVATALGVVGRERSLPADRVVHPEAEAGSPAARAAAIWKDPSALVGLGVTAAVCLVMAYLLVRSDMRGQAVLGAVIGAIVGGAVGGLATSAVSGRRPSVAPLITGAAFAGALGPIVAMVMTRDVQSSAITGELPGFAWTQPLDWAAAGLLGVPIGVRWASGRIEKQAAEAAARA
ncbi:MAG: hypothetical protein EA378_02560 [Phycisphaerales bacterium]|nr:MAG: hypothetical protein EA378_02560 [Phycisphaerales bacterium]